MKETIAYSRSNFFEKRVTEPVKAPRINTALAIMFCIVIIWLVLVPLLIFLLRGE